MLLDELHACPSWSEFLHFQASEAFEFRIWRQSLFFVKLKRGEKLFICHCSTKQENPAFLHLLATPVLPLCGGKGRALCCVRTIGDGAGGGGEGETGRRARYSSTCKSSDSMAGILEPCVQLEVFPLPALKPPPPAPLPAALLAPLGLSPAQLQS
jgi:hypothetical protein